MISVRSAISRSILGGRSTPNAAAAFLQANVPFPSFSNDRTDADNKYNTGFGSVRHLASPAYRRHLKRGNTGLKGQKPAIPASETGIQIPSLKVASDMGKGFSEMENEPLVVIAEMGNHRARTEVLRRHVMAVEHIDYGVAGRIVETINAKNKEGLFFYSFPSKFGMGLALCSGIVVFPLVFDISTAMWFNESFVTMEIPPPDELDTSLETGIWTWNWMEPITGTATLTLMCFQIIRQQLVILGIKPFTNRIMEHRTRLLCEAYPKYDKIVLGNFVETDPMT